MTPSQSLSRPFVGFVVCLSLSLCACDSKNPERRQAPPPAQAVEPIPLTAPAVSGNPHAIDPHAGHDHGPLPPNHPHLTDNTAAPPPADPHSAQTQTKLPEAALMRGEVLETMDAASYTYVRIKTASGSEVWAAGPQAPVAVGQHVELPPGMTMRAFVSKSLNKTFDEILFVDNLIVVGQPDAASPPPLSQQGQGGPAKVAPLDLPALPPLEGGVTVAQVLAGAQTLAGQEVRLRAAVVHQNKAILGRDWLHVQDGSRAPDGRYDLTVTTAQQNIQPGDVLLIRGKVAIDRDFGAGYRYDILLEDAQIEVERR